MSSAAAAFRKMHESGCFMLPNPWDVGSAMYLHHLGFKALATTSAGAAFARGLPDSVTGMDRDAMLAHIGDLVRATPLPVNADFQNGYADEPEGVAANVTACLATGVAGLSIEDATGRAADPLYEHTLAVERVRAARVAIDAAGSQVVLTARCEAHLVKHPEARRMVLERLTAFVEAGADCLYAPGVRDAKEIESIVRAVAPRPVNVLMAAPVYGLSLARLTDLGVRRVSVGSALARAAWAGFARAARALTEGSFDGLNDTMPFAELNALFGPRRS